MAADAPKPVAEKVEEITDRLRRVFPGVGVDNVAQMAAMPSPRQKSDQWIPSG